MQKVPSFFETLAINLQLMYPSYYNETSYKLHTLITEPAGKVLVPNTIGHISCMPTNRLEIQKIYVYSFPMALGQLGGIVSLILAGFRVIVNFRRDRLFYKRMQQGLELQSDSQETTKEIQENVNYVNIFKMSQNLTKLE